MDKKAFPSRGPGTKGTHAGRNKRLNLGVLLPGSFLSHFYRRWHTWMTVFQAISEWLMSS